MSLYQEMAARILGNEPSAQDHDWTVRAACIGLAHLMYPAPSKDEEIERAKGVCAQCPVRAQCLREALEKEERFGVWGGLTELERWELVKRRSKSKIRKWPHLSK